MKTKIALVVLILSLATILSSCAGMADGEYDLPGEYSIWYINSRSVVLCKDMKENGKVWGGEHLVEEYVSEIAYNDDYIFAKQVDVPEDINQKIDTSNPYYYVLVVETGKVFGPFSKKEFKAQVEEFNIKEIPKWISTMGLPKRENP